MSAPPILAVIAGRDPDRHRNDGHLTYIRAHARAAIRAGYEPQVMCVGATASVRETDIGTVRRAVSPSRRPRPAFLPIHGPVLVRSVERLARKRRRPVLIHGFGAWSWVSVRAADRLRRDGIRAVALASAYDTHIAAKARSSQGLAAGAALGRGLSFEAEVVWRRVVARYEGHAYRRAAAVFVNYDAVRRLIHDHYGDSVPVRRLPYGLEADFDPPSPASEPPPAELAQLQPGNAPLVVCVARLRPNKGVDVLIDALALARERGAPVRACIVGGGPLFEATRRRVGEAGLIGSVAMPGLVPDVEPYLRAADIYVQPSRAEQSGSMALLEALRAGAASVASRVDGIPEDVDDGESALLVRPGDPIDLADALTRLARDADLRARLGDGGRRRFAERFSAETFTEALAGAYAELGFEPATTRRATTARVG